MEHCGVLVFGCCVGPSGKFGAVAAPSLVETMTPGDVLIQEQGADGICAAYNRIIDQARTIDDCEGVVLLHDDTSLGARAREQLVGALRETGVGVVGVVGGRGLFGPQWVHARHRAGYANDFYGRRRYGPSTADVDVVDGLLLALSPSAFRVVRFDAEAFPAFHGYDTDYCLQVRDAGHRVRVVHIDYIHRDKGMVGDSEAFDASARALTQRWPERIRPLSPLGRFWRSSRDEIRVWGGRARHVCIARLKDLLGGSK